MGYTQSYGLLAVLSSATGPSNVIENDFAMRLRNQSGLENAHVHLLLVYLKIRVELVLSGESPFRKFGISPN